MQGVDALVFTTHILSALKISAEGKWLLTTRRQH